MASNGSSPNHQAAASHIPPANHDVSATSGSSPGVAAAIVAQPTTSPNVVHQNGAPKPPSYSIFERQCATSSSTSSTSSPPAATSPTDGVANSSSSSNATAPAPSAGGGKGDAKVFQELDEVHKLERAMVNLNRHVGGKSEMHDYCQIITIDKTKVCI